MRGKCVFGAEALEIWSSETQALSLRVSADDWAKRLRCARCNACLPRSSALPQLKFRNICIYFGSSNLKQLFRKTKQRSLIVYKHLFPRESPHPIT